MDLEKQLKNSLSNLGSVNYVTKNLINELKTCEGFEEKIQQIIYLIDETIDKIELKVLELLYICKEYIDLIEKDFYEYRAKLEEKMFEAFKIFSKKNL